MAVLSFLLSSTAMHALSLARARDTLPQRKEDYSLPPCSPGEVCSVPQPGWDGAEIDNLLRLCPSAATLTKVCVFFLCERFCCWCCRYKQAGSEGGVCQPQGLPHASCYQLPDGTSGWALCTWKEAGTERCGLCYSHALAMNVYPLTGLLSAEHAFYGTKGLKGDCRTFSFYDQWVPELKLLKYPQVGSTKGGRGVCHETYQESAALGFCCFTDTHSQLP